MLVCVCVCAGDRWSADHYLTSWPRKLFPAHFSDVLHPFFSSLLPLDPDARLAAVAANYQQLAAAVQASSGSSASQQQQQHVGGVRVRSSPLLVLVLLLSACQLSN